MSCVSGMSWSSCPYLDHDSYSGAHEASQIMVCTWIFRTLRVRFVFFFLKK